MSRQSIDTTGASCAGHFEALLQLATPELYERNAFRILELPVQASERELERRREMMQKSAASQLAAPPGALRLLPRPKPADEHELRDAGHALLDSERRLAHEFCWFWPLQPGQARDDDALTQLARGEIEAAAETWRRAQGEARAVARHNLAVLRHMQALELERATSPRAGLAKDALTGQQAQADERWTEALDLWQTLFDDEAFWSRVTARIRSIDDASLSTGAARRLQRSLPALLVLIQARLALRAIESGQPELARKQVQRLQETHWDSAAMEEGLRRAIEPLRSLLKSLRDTAERAAEADAEHADAEAERLLDQAAAPLATLDLLLPQTHPARQAEHDLLAQRALNCLISFGNSTGNHRRSLELLDRIVPLAAGTAVKERVVLNRATVSDNLQAQTCWTCGQNPLDEAQTIEVPMHGNIVREEVPGGVRTSWQHAKVRVPRCKQCADEDRLLAQTGGAALLAFNLGLVASLLLYAPLDLEIPGIAAGAATVAGAVTLMVRDRRRRARRCRPQLKRARDEHPAIQKLKAEGWAFGDEPVDAQ